MAITHKASQLTGSAVDFIKVKSVAHTTLTGGASTVRDAVMATICQRGTNPMIVGDGYTVGSDSYLLVAMKKDAWNAADLQAAIRACGVSDLSDCVVTFSDTLVG